MLMIYNGTKELETLSRLLLLPDGLQQAVSWVEQQPSVHFHSYKLVINKCSTCKSLVHARRIHCNIVERGYGRVIFLSNLLLGMYSRCGSIQDARGVFDSIQKPEVYSWALVISAYSLHRFDREAIQLLYIMDLEGTRPDEYVFSSVICSCSRLENLLLGTAIHKRILESGMGYSSVLGNNLVVMYGRLNRVDLAEEVFYSFNLFETIAWNSLLSANALNGYLLQVWELLRRMDLEGVKSSSATFVILLDVCSKMEDAERGEEIHSRIIETGSEADVKVGNSIVNMYGKCGRIENAKEAFEEMHLKDVVSWNSMLSAYAQDGHNQEVLTLFRRMELEGVEPTRVTFLILFDACPCVKGVNTRLHDRVIGSGLLETDILVANSLMNMHVKCGCLGAAQAVFDKLGHRKDVVSWNTMIAAYAQKGDAYKACLLFRNMDLEGVEPDKASFASVLEACNLEQGNQIHMRLTNLGVKPDVVLAIALIGMYARHNMARNVVDTLFLDDIIVWNSMLAAYIQCGESKYALQLHREMDLRGLKLNTAVFANLLTVCSLAGELTRGVEIHTRVIETGWSQNVVITTALINLYARCGELSTARGIFNESCVKDVVCWTAMVVGYARQGYEEQAMEVFRNMEQEGVMPNKVTFINVLFACSHSGLLNEGCMCFSSMVGDYGTEVVMDHYMCLVDLFGRVGKLTEAKDVVENMPFHGDYVGWMTLVGACRTQGDLRGGEDAAERVMGLERNLLSYEV